MVPTREEWMAALEARHGKQLQERFSTAAVAVCGLGGLGSNIAIALARAGVGKLILIDFDRVDITNLHRQQYKASQVGLYKTEAMAENLKEIAPYIDLELHTVRVSEAGERAVDASTTDAPEAGVPSGSVSALLKDADVICEAFDNAEAKAMLTNAVLEQLPGKYLVAASGMAGLGSANSIHTRQVMKRFYLCGDEVSDVSGEIGLVAPRVMVCAAHQAHMVLRILAGEPVA